MKENGELTDDPAEQAEILKKQYESVASKPMEEFKVKEDFFIENVGNTPDQTNDQLKHALLTSHWPSLLCQIA